MAFDNISRRDFLNQQALGVDSVALAWLLQQDHAGATPKSVPKQPLKYDLQRKPPHHRPRAKAMISLFQHGGPSHMDLTDPKPELTKFSGTDYSGSVGYSFANNAALRVSGNVPRHHARGTRPCGTSG